MFLVKQFKILGRLNFMKAFSINLLETRTWNTHIVKNCDKEKNEE